MSVLLRPVFILLFTLLLPSCALLQKTPEKLNSQINYWLKEKQFDRIESALDTVEGNSEYKTVLKRKASIRNAKTDYINTVSRNARKLKQQQKWQQAITVYVNALEKVRDDPRLTQELKALIKERDQKIHSLRKQLLVKSALAHISYDEIYDALNILAPIDPAAQRDIEKHKHNKRVLARHLETCGEKAYQEELYQLAYDCYSASNRLKPSEQKQYWVSRISKQVENIKNHQRYTELLASYEKAYEQKQYSKAKLHLDTLLAINPDHKIARQKLISLNEKISRQVTEKIKLGQELYSKKKIRQALEIWKQAQALSPENAELIQLIKRAEKVSKKIESLEDKQ